MFDFSQIYAFVSNPFFVFGNHFSPFTSKFKNNCKNFPFRIILYKPKQSNRLTKGLFRGMNRVSEVTKFRSPVFQIFISQ